MLVGRGGDADELVVKAGEVANDRLLIVYSSAADVLSTNAATLYGRQCQLDSQQRKLEV